MITIYLALLVSIVGLILYLLTNHPKASAVSLYMFAVGLLAFLLLFGHR